MRNAPAMHGNDHIYGGPDPIPWIPGSLWASATGGGTGGTSAAFNYYDVSQLVTNAPGIFQLATGGNGSTGIEVLAEGEFRMWSGFDVFVTGTGGVVGTTKGGQQWMDFLGYYARISHEFTRGQNLISGFFSSTDDVVFSTYTLLDFENVGGAIVATTPNNVIEFGFAQNTGSAPTCAFGCMIEVLTTDISTVTFLP